MRKTLCLKFMALYLVFCILSFLSVSTLSMSLTRKYEMKKMADSLYQDASRIASGPLLQSYMDSKSSLDDLYIYFSSAAAYQNTTIWLMDCDGNILLNTSRKLNEDGFPEKFPGLDPSAFTGSYYQVGDFFGYFSKDVLSVVSPVTSSYSVKGYVVIHCYLSKIDKECNSALNVSYISLLSILLLSLLLAAGFFFMVYRPLRRLVYAADEYAAGNFNYTFISEHKDEIGYLGASLQYMAGQVNKSGESQRKFISNISHDFRSPLTSIKGYVEAILDGTIPLEMQERYLNIVLTETERLEKLTKGLLTLNTFDDHGYFMDMSDFDINEVIKKTVETFEGVCFSRGITFSLIFDDARLMVHADKEKIQQVIYNLIDNAVKFSHNDSKIHIETLQKHAKVFVSVKDTGMGIPQASLQKIWERFYKTDLSRGKDTKGTGLGLSITKEIIQAHGEHINVVSTEGVGSEFTFTLQSAQSNNGFRISSKNP